MNRRNFLTAAGGGAAAALLQPLPINAQSQQVNTAPYNALSASTAIAAGNALYATPTGNDWATVSNTLYSVATDWNASNYDAQLQSYYANLTPSQISTSNPNMNWSSLLANVQIYQPAITLADLQNGFAYIDQLTPDTVASVISTLQTSGFQPFLPQGEQSATQVAMTLGYVGVPPKGGPLPPLQPPSSASFMRIPRHSAHLVPTAYRPHAQLLRVSDCAGLHLAAYAVGAAAFTVACMASGGVFLLAGWGAVALGLGGAAFGMNTAAILSC